jgi:hypothetical protein
LRARKAYKGLTLSVTVPVKVTELPPLGKRSGFSTNLIFCAVAPVAKMRNDRINTQIFNDNNFFISVVCLKEYEHPVTVSILHIGDFPRAGFFKHQVSNNIWGWS